MMKSTLIKDLYGEIERLKAGNIYCRHIKLQLTFMLWSNKNGKLILLSLFISMSRGLCFTGKEWGLHA